jgi:membrane protein DedA with SNARE-associated domain
LSAFTSLQVDAPLSYLIAVVLPALDAIFPVLPSETAVIALGVATAGSADPRIAVLIACAAAGAFLGDNLSYLIGRRFGALGGTQVLRQRQRRAQPGLGRAGLAPIRHAGDHRLPVHPGRPDGRSR